MAERAGVLLVVAALLAVAVPACAGGSVGPVTGGVSGLTESMVMDHAVVSDRPATVFALTSRQDAAGTRAALREAWRHERPGPVIERQGGGWLILSTTDADGIETVQLRDTPGGSVGYRTIWHRRDGTMIDAAPRQAPAWLLADLDIHARQGSRDGGRDVQTVLASSASAPAFVLAMLRARLEGEGFIADPVLQRSQGDALLSVYRRGREEVALSVSARGAGAGLAIHWIGAR